MGDSLCYKLDEEGLAYRHLVDLDIISLKKGRVAVDEALRNPERMKELLQEEDKEELSILVSEEEALLDGGY